MNRTQSLFQCRPLQGLHVDSLKHPPLPHCQGFSSSPPRSGGKAKSGGLNKSGKVPNKDLDALGQQLKAAVTSGKMTKEEAIAKWNEAVAGKDGNTGKGSNEGNGQVDLKELAQQLKAVVASGRYAKRSLRKTI